MLQWSLCPNKKKVGVNEACTCRVKYTDACFGCPCVVVSDSCLPVDGPEIRSRCKIGGSFGGFDAECERTVIGKKCLCSGSANVQCKEAPSNAPSVSRRTRKLGGTGRQGGYVLLDNENSMMSDASGLGNNMVCEAEIYPNGEVKNKNCTKLPIREVRNPVEAFSAE